MPDDLTIEQRITRLEAITERLAREIVDSGPFHGSTDAESLSYKFRRLERLLHWEPPTAKQRNQLRNQLRGLRR